MRRFPVILSVIFLLTVCHSVVGLQAGGHGIQHDMPDEQMTAPRPEDYHSPPAEPAKGQSIRRYAVDDTGPGATNFGVNPVHDDPLFMTLRSDRLEYRTSSEAHEVLLWDWQAWIGRDYDRVYIESEGEWANGEDQPESAQVELLYGRTITSFWDLRLGVRQDFEPDPERTFAVLGLMGLAPQWFETELNLNLGEVGDMRVDWEVEYNLLFSQRLILQPRLETQFSFSDQDELELGQGFTEIELGARMRYEFTRKFAPYIGVSWESTVGETRDISRRSGEDPDAFFLVSGVRFWF